MHDKAFNIAKNPKYDGYQSGLASIVYNFFDKRASGGAAAVANKSAVKNKNMSNKELAKELQKLIIKKFKKRKVQSPFISNIWGADLADMQLISKFNKRICFLFRIIDVFSKYGQVIPVKDKRGIATTNAFQKVLKESNHKPNKIWADKGSEYYNRSMKSLLEKSEIEMYSTNNEGQSVVSKRFIRALKNKIYKYMSSISKMYILIN